MIVYRAAARLRQPLPEDKPLQVPTVTGTILAICAAGSIILGTLPLLITSGS